MPGDYDEVAKDAKTFCPNPPPPGTIPPLHGGRIEIQIHGGPRRYACHPSSSPWTRGPPAPAPSSSITMASSAPSPKENSNKSSPRLAGSNTTPRKSGPPSSPSPAKHSKKQNSPPPTSPPSASPTSAKPPSSGIAAP